MKQISRNFVLFTVAFLSTSACIFSIPAGNNLQETVDSIRSQQTQIEATGIYLTRMANTPSLQFNNFQEEATKIPTVVLTPSLSPVISIENSNIDQNPKDEMELERRIKASKILVFENISGSNEIRYVKRALDEADYFYLDVGSATGWFKNQLQLNEDWDLIIAAAEARRSFGGEYFEYIHNRLKQGASAVIEYWDIDEISLGKIKPLLDDCGVKFQSDWYEPDMRSVFWIKKDHPVLNEPNEMDNKLGEAQPLWRGDIGDLLEINSSESKAELLAGTGTTSKDSHGTLAVCFDGRLIFQTFSSHEFGMQEMVALWQNYVYQTLKNHHQLTAEQVFMPPAESPLEASNPDQEDELPSGNVNSGTVGEVVNCGPLSVKVPRSPYAVMDMFEHHAAGEYLIVDLEIVNHLDQAVQIWDGDYFVREANAEESMVIGPDRAATGYLFIENPVSLIQDQVKPGGVWRTTIAFDVPLDGNNWVFGLKPGGEIGHPICEVQIALQN